MISYCSIIHIYVDYIHFYSILSEKKKITDRSHMIEMRVHYLKIYSCNGTRMNWYIEENIKIFTCIQKQLVLWKFGTKLNPT